MEISPTTDRNNIGFSKLEKSGCFDKWTVITFSGGVAAVAAAYMSYPPLAIAFGIGASIALYKKLTADPIASCIEKMKSTDPKERCEALSAFNDAYLIGGAKKVPLNVLEAILVMVNDVDNQNARDALALINYLMDYEHLNENGQIKIIIDKFINILEDIAKNNLDLNENRCQIVGRTISVLYHYLYDMKKAEKIDGKNVNVDTLRLSMALSNLAFTESCNFRNYTLSIREVLPQCVNQRFDLKIQDLQSRDENARKAAIESFFPSIGVANAVMDKSQVPNVIKIANSDKSPSVRSAAFKALVGAFDNIDFNDQLLVIKMLFKYITDDVHTVQALGKIQELIQNDKLKDPARLQAVIDGFVDYLKNPGPLEWRTKPKTNHTDIFIKVINLALLEFIQKYIKNIKKEGISVSHLQESLKKIKQDIADNPSHITLRRNMQTILERLLGWD